MVTDCEAHMRRAPMSHDLLETGRHHFHKHFVNLRLSLIRFRIQIAFCGTHSCRLPQQTRAYGRNGFHQLPDHITAHHPSQFPRDYDRSQHSIRAHPFVRIQIGKTEFTLSHSVSGIDATLTRRLLSIWCYSNHVFKFVLSDTAICVDHISHFTFHNSHTPHTLTFIWFRLIIPWCKMQMHVFSVGFRLVND